MSKQELLEILENGLSSEKLVAIAKLRDLVDREDLIHLRRIAENEVDMFVKNAIKTNSIKTAISIEI